MKQLKSKVEVIDGNNAFKNISESIERLLYTNGFKDVKVSTSNFTSWTVEFHKGGYGNEIPMSILNEISLILNLPVSDFRVHSWNHNESSWLTRLDVVFKKEPTKVKYTIGKYYPL